MFGEQTKVFAAGAIFGAATVCVSLLATSFGKPDANQAAFAVTADALAQRDAAYQNVQSAREEVADQANDLLKNLRAEKEALEAQLAEKDATEE